ncbi:MAG: hypothetical protein GY910_27730 [bacterium]|nr:hypothetical protein [bacterium]
MGKAEEYKRLDPESVAPLFELCKMTATDRSDGRECLQAAGLKPLIVGRAHLYPVVAGVRALCDRKLGQAPADERNLAQAEKVRLETQILEGRFRPIAELEEAIGVIGAAITRVVEESELDADQQEKIAQTVIAAVQGLKEGVEE